MKSKSHHKCPICFTTNQPRVGNFFSCTKCKALYTFPIKSKDYTTGYWDAFYNTCQVNKSKIDFFKHIIDSNKEVFSDTILDVGAGHGYFIKALGREIIGVDNNLSAINRAYLDYNVKIDEFDVEDPFAMIRNKDAIRVKTVCLHHTLECLRTPVQTLKYLMNFSEKYVHIIAQRPTAQAIVDFNFCLYNKETIEILAEKVGGKIVKFEEKDDSNWRSWHRIEVVLSK